MEKKINELKSLIEEGKKLHAISLDETLDEETTDTAYAKYYEAMDKAAVILIGLIGVDAITAKRMVHWKADEIISLISRMAA